MSLLRNRRRLTFVLLALLLWASPITWAFLGDDPSRHYYGGYVRFHERTPYADRDTVFFRNLDGPLPQAPPRAGVDCP